MDFELLYSPTDAVTKSLEIASATVIEAGDMVTLTSGLVTKGVAASTQLGYALTGSASGDTDDLLVLTDERAVFKGTGDANFAKTMRATEVDLVGTTTQLIDVGASATDVFKIEAGSNAGTVGSTADILVSINKPL